MGRLIDTLMRQNIAPDQRTVLSTATVLKADNVLALLESMGKPADMQMVRSLPQVVPPIHDLFVEFDIQQVGGVGWLLHAFDLSKDRDKNEFGISEARWMVRGYFFIGNNPKQPHMTASYYVNADGSLHRISDGDHAVEYYLRPTKGSVYAKAWQENPYGAWMYAPVVSLNVALWAICFMHAKNAMIEEVAIPEKLNRAALKKYEQPLMRYHMLKIKPMTRAHKDDAGGTHASPSLHIRRGHWRTYTEDRPLFGKVAGTFWFDQAIVGNEKRGVVMKDYEVEP